jgi:hypothetical protein
VLRPPRRPRPSPSRSLRHTEERPLHRCRAPVLPHCCLARPPHLARCPTARTRALVPATAAPASVPQICEASFAASTARRPLFQKAGARSSSVCLAGCLSGSRCSACACLVVSRAALRRCSSACWYCACLLARLLPRRRCVCRCSSAAPPLQLQLAVKRIDVACAASPPLLPLPPRAQRAAAHAARRAARNTAPAACQLPASRPLRYTPHRTPRHPAAACTLSLLLPYPLHPVSPSHPPLPLAIASPRSVSSNSRGPSITSPHA